MANTKITSRVIADDAVTTAAIADDAITSATIADDAVVTASIADDAITSALIADDAVNIGNINTVDATGGGSSPSADGQALVAKALTDGYRLDWETISGTTINNNADNRLITGSGTANTLEGEANLTFDGTNVVIGSSNALGLLTIKAPSSDDQDLITISEDGTNQAFSINSNFAGAGSTNNNITLDSYWTNDIITFRGDGNVGIGTASPASLLDVRGGNIYVDGGGSGGASQVILTTSASSGANFGQISNTGTRWSLGYGGSIGTVGTEVLTWNSSGNVGIGTTGQLGGGWDAALNVSNNNNIAFFKSTGGGGSAGVGIQVGTYTATTTALVFYNGSGGVAGSISLANGNASTTVSYNTSSDYRLKENVVTDWDATTRLKQLKPSRFNFIADADTTVDGFLAHEVQDIVPEAITGTKDATEELTNVVINNVGNVIARDIEEDDWIAGKEDETYPSDSTWEATHTANVYQGIDQAKLVPLLTKALQEALTKIEQLESRIETLEG